MASRCVEVDPTEQQLCNTEQEQQLGALVWCSLVLVLGWLGKIRIDPRSSSSQGEAAAAAQTIALSGPETAYFYLSSPGPGHMSPAATQWSSNNDGFVSKAAT